MRDVFMVCTTFVDATPLKSDSHSQTSIVSVWLFFFFLPATCGGEAMVEETKREKRRVKERNVERERESDVKRFWV